MVLSSKNQLRDDFFNQMAPNGRRLGDAGQAIVEFAFVAPVLLAILAGILEFSGILFVQTVLEGGARQASRHGVTGSTAGDISREDMILQIIENNAHGIIETNDIEMDTLIYETFSDVGQAEPFEDANGNGAFDEGEPFDDINGNAEWDGARRRRSLSIALRLAHYDTTLYTLLR